MNRTRFRVLLGLGALAAVLTWGALELAGQAGVQPFMPHAHCYLFNKALIMLHGGSDLLIGLSYVSISATLVYLVLCARRELPFHWMMLAFAAFIVACGATHFMEVWTLEAEHPRYWLAGAVKAVTAAASLITAVLLPPLVPKIRAVLQSARLAGERQEQLETAFAELTELYQKAVKAEGMADVKTKPLAANGEAQPRDLAVMAKEVTVHARELERAKQAAESANQAKDQFLAVLSHELRTPLTPALAAAGSLEQAAILEPGEVRETLGMIRRNIELEARLVDDLLDITRISKGKLEVYLDPVNLHDAIKHAVEMCRAAAGKKGLQLVTQLEADDKFVLGDAARLAQVFWNLTLNAVKFTSEGGTVTIRSFNPQPGVIAVSVRDNGIGIEAAMLSRIFEPFEQGDASTARRYGGVGLGLTIARSLVEAHGGKLTVESPGKGRGATFMLELATADARPASTPGNGVIEASPRRRRILLVEDHEDTREALTRLLCRWGHEVCGAASVTEALAKLREFEPELLLSDVGLPDGTGMDLLTKLRGWKEIPAIAMSGFGMSSDLEQTRRAGFLAHLVKPVAAARLRETIDQV